jgi:hypothetical protein
MMPAMNTKTVGPTTTKQTQKKYTQTAKHISF